MVGCDLELFPRRSQIRDSWFATRGSMSSFESLCFKSADNITVTLLTPASPQSFPGAWARSSAQLTPPGTRSRVDPSYRDNWPQREELMAQAVLSSWSHPGARGLWSRRGARTALGFGLLQGAIAPRCPRAQGPGLLLGQGDDCCSLTEHHAGLEASCSHPTP